MDEGGSQTTSVPHSLAAGESRWRLTRFVFLTSWCCAIALGAAQLLVDLYRHALRHQIIWQSRDIVWMAPAGYLLLFTAAAIPVALLVVAVPRLVPRQLLAGAFVAAAALGFLLLFRWIHPVAMLILAVGIGIRLAPLACRPALSRRWKLSGWLLILVMASLATGEAFAQRTGRRAERTATLPAPGAPNVLLIIWDTVRAASVSLYGYSRPTTPALDHWASDGVIFDWAFSTAPWTLPSHGSIMTGVTAGEQSGNWRTPLDGRQQTLAEHFASHGYATGGFVANLNYTHAYSGLSRGFVTYDEHRRSVAQVLLSTTFLQVSPIRRVFAILPGRIGAALRRNAGRGVPPYWATDRKLDGVVSDQFLRWQRALDRRPFFAFLNYNNAHEYSAPDSYHALFGPETDDRAKYDRSIAYLDAEVRRVLDSLSARGALDNTLVILTSDHGELLGEHGLFQHGNSLYMQELHVPLVFRFPRMVPAGSRINEAVSLRDLGHTILSLALPSDSAAFPGRSILTASRATDASTPVLAEVTKAINGQPGTPASKGDMFSLIDGRLHYIRNGDGTEELYAYRDTGGDVENLATTPEGLVAIQAFRLQLRGLLEHRARPGNAHPVALGR